MAEMKQPKYQIGQSVVTSDGEVCAVLRVSFDGKQWSYMLSSREVNPRKREIVDGVKHVLESELKPVEDKE